MEDPAREGDRVYLVDLGRGDDWKGKGKGEICILGADCEYLTLVVVVAF